jgi:acyl carrier protein
MILKAMQDNYARLGQVVVCQMDWQNYLKNNSSRLFQEFEVKNQSSISSNILNEIASAPYSERLELIGQFIIREVSVVIGVKNSNEIDLKKGLMELGIDSLAAVDLKTRLEINLKISLKATLAFDYPTLEGLIEHIASKVIGHETAAPSEIVNQVLTDENDIASQLERELESLKDG